MSASTTILLLDSLCLLLIFAAGSAFGSFLNVCILRISAGQSVVRPGSRCPRCRKPIRWWDNIPVLSYILLRGRCRNCGKGISWQYPLVEALTGLYFVLAWERFPEDPVKLGWIWALGFVSILLSGIDIRTYRLPDRIVFPFMAAAALFTPFNPFLGADWRGRVEQGALGFGVAGGGLWLIALLGTWFLKKEAMGGGDIKLLAALGLSLGWEKAVDGLFDGSLFCLLAVAVLLALGRWKPGKRIPFGPFLCAGCLTAAFFPGLGLFSRALGPPAPLASLDMIWAFC